MARTFRVEFRRLGQTLEIGEREIILEKALDAGLELDYGCLGGSCATCMVRVHGEVFQWGVAIDDDEKAAGKVLICSAYPRADLVIE
ncbi:MAG: 2Fe-2S iron-sulfur cluster-binding protein [Candidatus Xenobia bacterium]